VAELADALDSGAKTTRLANPVPSTQPAENAGFVFGARWRTLAGFCGEWARNGHGAAGVNPSVETIRDWHTCRSRPRDLTDGQGKC